MTFGSDLTVWDTNVGRSDGSTFRAMTDNRKRPRDEDTCDFMPLSKRINNLHINNNLVNGCNLGVPQEASQSAMTGPSTSQQAGLPARPSYDPGITSSQSSYYFDNKLLFELHLQRIQRNGQQFPF